MDGWWAQPSVNWTAMQLDQEWDSLLVVRLEVASEAESVLERDGRWVPRARARATVKPLTWPPTTTAPVDSAAKPR